MVNYQKLPFTASLLAAAVTMTACSGGGNSSNSDPQDINVPNPAPVLPTYAVEMNGGDGAEGGRGGNFYLYREGTGGAIRVSAEASIDPAAVSGVSIPEVTADSGSNPLVVSSDLTIDVSNSEPAVGQVYYFEGSLYIYDGAMTDDEVPQPDLGTEATVVTGINVAEGATLTFSSSSIRRHEDLTTFRERIRRFARLWFLTDCSMASKKATA